MEKIDKLSIAIRMYNDVVEKYVKAVMTDDPEELIYYSIRADAMEDMILALFFLGEDFTFVDRCKPYPDGKRDFVYKYMVEVE